MPISHRKDNYPVRRAYELIRPKPLTLLTVSAGDITDVGIVRSFFSGQSAPDQIVAFSRGGFLDEVIRKSRQCVFNLMPSHMHDANWLWQVDHDRGDILDKLARHRLTPEPAKIVEAPLIQEAYANLECVFEGEYGSRGQPQFSCSPGGRYCWRVVRARRWVRMPPAPQIPFPHWDAEARFQSALVHRALERSRGSMR